jgi:RimJ/RimL family protein N-acetyltransferase
MGAAVDATPRPFPERVIHRGQAVSLEPLADEHVAELWEATRDSEASFIHLRYGPFCTVEALADTVRDLSCRRDQPFWAARRLGSGKAEGWLSLCDVYPADAAIEIGSIWFSPRLQRTRAATEAVFLLMRHAFDDLRYKRLVWRCQALNAASLRAAERYGFVAEGIWRMAVIIKGEQRDIAWHSMLDSEWPGHKSALLAWLSDENFRSDDSAIASLSEMRKRGMR